MKKRLSKIIYIALIIIAILIFLFMFVQTVFFKKTFPQLAPFIPDFAPYDISVTVLLDNFPPIIDINSSIFICEDAALSYEFMVIDPDDGTDLLDMEVTLDPSDPFFVSPGGRVRPFNATADVYDLRSGALNKTHAGGTDAGWQVYPETIAAKDGRDAVSTKDIDIVVIEINHAPELGQLNPPGLFQVWTYGDDSIFYHQVLVNDTEEINQESPDINFNITILNSSGDEVTPFDITPNGIMNFNPNQTLDFSTITLPHDYTVTVCAYDPGLPNPHQNISSECKQTGESMYDCETFILRVTDENRPPVITSYYPTDLNLNVGGNDNLYFNISKYDPEGLIPEAYWYVNGTFIEYDNGSLIDEFNYKFGCGKSGTVPINVTITDGDKNDSVQWIVTYSYVSCDPGPGPGPGNGPTGTSSCEEKWGCGNWMICQNAIALLEDGTLSGDDYRIVKEQCDDLGFLDEKCGYQEKLCVDVKNCKTNKNKPINWKVCHYTNDPRCNDGIKNCRHDGSCELLVDCGGPCAPCSTCSDGIQNQNEEGTDCGGPCPWKCKIEEPSPMKRWIFYLLGTILVLIIIILIRFRKILQYKEQVTQAPPPTLTPKLKT